MSIDTNLPLTNAALAEWALRQAVRWRGTEAEYWDLAARAEYRVDFFQGEIIATMSYETEAHASVTMALMFILRDVFAGQSVRFGNSNRPVCIPACDHAIFNPDGSVMVVPGRKYVYRPGMDAELEPWCLFEVLSPSTRQRDLEEKLPCYRQIPGLRQILLVDLARVQVTVLTRSTEVNDWQEEQWEDLDDTCQLNGQAVGLRAIYRPLLDPEGEWPG